MCHYCMEDILKNRAISHLLESAEVMQQTVQLGLEPILRASDQIAFCFKNKKKLLLCGNGGSAADCQHMAAEFLCRLSANFERPALPAIALTTDTSFLTAYSNDYSFSKVFERGIQAIGQQGDVLLGISTSGSSENVIRAIQAAKSMNIYTICLIGQEGKLSELADISIKVPSRNTLHIQEAHQAIIHVMCDLVERSLFPQSQK